MKTWLKTWPIMLALGLVACAYDPPMQANHGSAVYQADLRACRKSAATTASRTVHATGPMFMTYPISYPIQDRIDIRRCMQAKGYSLRP